MARWRWYRKLLGGTWYKVAPWPSLPYIDPMWVRYPTQYEIVLKEELY